MVELTGPVPVIEYTLLPSAVGYVTGSFTWRWPCEYECVVNGELVKVRFTGPMSGEGTVICSPNVVL